MEPSASSTPPTQQQAPASQPPAASPLPGANPAAFQAEKTATQAKQQIGPSTGMSNSWLDRLPPAHRQLLGLSKQATPHPGQSRQPEGEALNNTTLPVQLGLTPSNPHTGAGLLEQWSQQWNTQVNPHLDELRQRLLACILSWVVASVFGVGLAPMLITWLKHQAPANTAFVQLQPGEVLWLTLKVGLLSGLALSLPISLFQALRFISPGLTQGERRWVLPIALGSSLLLLAGLLFSALAVLPVTLDFLLSFGSGLAQNQQSIARYTEFCLLVIFLVALAFELPMAVLLLVKLRIIKTQHLEQQWRWVVTGLFVASALLTPGQDPFSMVLVAAVLSTLCALSWGLLKLLKL
jgi:sec-independent protein translocase protein TatC